MAHINSLGAGIYSDLSVCFDATLVAAARTAVDGGTAADTTFEACFASGKYTRITDVREFPAMGTPPNVVNVPVYGSKTSFQIQGQSDPTSMEITINFKPSDWADGSVLGDKVGDGKEYVFRFTLMNTKPYGYDATTGSISSADNSSYYWMGKIDALLVTPQLTDANTATVTITMQSEFYGAYTV